MQLQSRVRYRPLLVLIFCLSGASALAYQVLWCRQLTFVLGGSAIAVSTILATFMGGLGLGGWIGGRLADRVGNTLRFYALAELLIALSALATPFLLSTSGSIYLGLYGLFSGHPALVTASRALATGVILIVPTTMMGATLPFMARFYIRNIDSLGRGLGTLYGINILGGVLGAALAGYYSILTFGVWNTFLLAVAVNLTASLSALILSFVAPHQQSGAGTKPILTEPSGPPPARALARPRTFLLLAMAGFFVSGFTGLAYEVLWTRALNFAIGNSVFAFTTVLVVFLLGLFLGSVFAGLYADRCRSPLLFVGWVQLLGGLSMVAAFAFADKLPALTRTMVNHLGAGNVLADAVTKIIPTSAALLLPTVILGFTFPFLMKSTARRLEALGRRLGDAYAVNTAGAILGSLAAGYLLLPTVGMVKGMYVVALVNVLMALGLFLASERSRPRRILVPVSALAGAFLLVGVFVINPRPLIESLPVVKNRNAEILSYEEGHTATVTVVKEKATNGEFKNLSLYINLLGASVTDNKYFHQQYYTVLSILPTALHPDPRRVFVAGHASGVTTGAAALDQRTERVTCVEISPEVIRAARLFADYNFNVAENPRVEILADDARAYLATTDDRYDLLITDCFISAVTGTAALYSREYFELCRSRLAPGGYTSIGVGNLTGTGRTVAMTFCEVFPHVALFRMPRGSWYNYVFLLGANDPFAFEAGALDEAYAQPALQAELERYGLGRSGIITGGYVCDSGPLKDLLEGTQICTDDLPVIDFQAVAWAEGFVSTPRPAVQRGLGWLRRERGVPMPFPWADQSRPQNWTNEPQVGPRGGMKPAG